MWFHQKHASSFKQNCQRSCLGSLQSHSAPVSANSSKTRLPLVWLFLRRQHFKRTFCARSSLTIDVSKVCGKFARNRNWRVSYLKSFPHCWTLQQQPPDRSQLSQNLFFFKPAPPSPPPTPPPPKYCQIFPDWVKYCRTRTNILFTFTALSQQL